MKIEILYEDNHVIVVNKSAGDLVHPDTDGEEGLEQALKEYLKMKYDKQGNVYLGVVHRLDRPVSGAILFAKTSKALSRLNKQLREQGFDKKYWAIVEKDPEKKSDQLTHNLLRNRKQNKSYVTQSKTEKGVKEAVLNYKSLQASDHYFLLEVELITGRHHQIRCQLSHIGSPIKGDLKYGASRSNPDGSISLHSRILSFNHPTTQELITVTAPVPSEDNLWAYFETSFK